MSRKLSELPDFASKPLLYAAQKRGAKIAGLPAEVHLIGLAEILWEANVGNIRDYGLSPEEIKEMIGPPKTTPPNKKRWWNQWIS